SDGSVEAVDMEDFGVPGSIGAMAKPRTGVARKAVAKRRGAVARADQELSTVEGVSGRLALLGVAPDPSDGYAAWLQHSKQIWALRRRLRVLRLKAIANGDDDMPADDAHQPQMAGAGIGQFFARTQASLTRSIWHVLQWVETDTPGELKAWVWVGGQVHSVRVSVPRTLYVTSTVASQEISRSKFFSEARAMVLPRTTQTAHLYKCVMSESEFTGFQSSWSSFFAHPSIGGVYETEITPMDRALIQLGGTVWLSAAARRLGVGRSDVVGMDDLDTRRTALTQPQTAGWAARDMSYALLYHASSQDGRHHFYALVMPYAGRGHVW
ncbi:DNA polymerase epsilon catalytic subunit, partial [Coemansia sp. S610]